MIKYNLQYFAKDGPGGEKTEPATAKKLEDARKEGQVAKSNEINSALMLFGFFIILKIWIGTLGTKFLESFSAIYNLIPEMVLNKDQMMETRMYTRIVNETMFIMLQMVAPIFLVGFMISLIADLAQVKWKPTMKPLQPKLNKFSPINGLKKIVSTRAIFELFKSVFKIGIIAYVAYSTLKSEQEIIFRLYDIPLKLALTYIGEIIIDLGIKLSAVYMIVGLADYIYQKYKFTTDMKMTKQEIKDEYKNAEGNPEIKGKIRSKMQEASRRRMMQSLSTADVVITNPTHFAVAVKYDAENASAPIVVAKGEDYLAQKIRENAKEYHIEIVENKPLARMLYYNVDVGEQIPPELYQAVAEVLAYVYSLKHS
ncbi:flagellar biosynthesis protein FlhB [Konateibacter massiliensis]|uniref:flagellar biosynthesis protein FlhB n=1 Tax=Konateibacter massiliensis TaxID=2002841 RepID=UPI000C1578EC|nr:flagellar biosynthesis protein FlhB [Konateibacter massiliensis]